METPVIYFYTDEPRTVTVRVDFPEGLFSEWYPDFSASQMRFHRATDRRVSDRSTWPLENGGLTWEVDLHPDTVLPVPPVPEDDIWAPSRRVPDAAFVSHGDQNEHFIFYRGVARFEPAVLITHDDTRYRIFNASHDPIPATWILEVDGDHGRVQELGPVPSREAIEHVSLDQSDAALLPIDDLVALASELMLKELVETGLTEDESRAMVDTWSTSYFRTPGQRVFYVVPRTWTDAIIPMHVEPRPARTVRTLIGRVEVLTPSDEREILDALIYSASFPDTSSEVITDFRFSEPRIHRGCYLARTAVPENGRLHSMCRELHYSLRMSHLPATEW